MPTTGTRSDESRPTLDVDAVAPERFVDIETGAATCWSTTAPPPRVGFISPYVDGNSHIR